MSETTPGRPAASFDLPPERLRELGYRLVDGVVESIAHEVADPVLPRAEGDRLHRSFEDSLPRAGLDSAQLEMLYEELLGDVNRKNGHPGFFGYVCPSADPLGVLADLAISATNQNVTAWRSAPGATERERQVLRWLDELVGFGGEGGMLTSGGSLANLTALSCAVERCDAPRERQVLYVSRETHFSLAKAARMLGIDARAVDMDGERKMSVSALARAIESDLANARHPVCVCASAGTTNTGAIDPLTEVAEVANANGAWLHVDGAYGAPAAATDTYAWMKDGFARADSLSLDPHKWLFAPLDVGALLLRREADARRAFDLTGEYAVVEGEDPIESHSFFALSPELSRRARAAKVWAILRGRGADALVAEIGRHVALREHLDARVDADPRLEGLGSGLSITCFRYVPPGGASDEELDGRNRAIQRELVASGRFLLSPTTVGGRVALRVCIVNFRTRERDVDALVDAVLELGHAVAC